MNSLTGSAVGKIRGSRRLIMGSHLVEVLVASAIMSVSLAAIVSMFVFGFRITQHSDDTSIAYNVCRQELERVRLEGFKNTVIVRSNDGTITSRGLDGTQTFYYGPSGAKLGNSTGAAYSVIVSIISDKFDTVNGGIQRPADDSLRTVTVVVTRLSDNTVVHREGTYLSRSGI